VEHRISEREDKTEIKEKTEEISQIAQELWKEYARTQQLHQKPKGYITYSIK
jgi:hypothetical protein